MRVALIALALLLGGCSQDVTLHSADAYPQRLSEWGVIRREGTRLVLGEGVLPYDINTALFSDYALKLRTVWMPAGTSAGYRADDVLDLPTGTVLSKSFFYHRNADGALERHTQWDGDVSALDLDAVELIETRLLVRQEHGWDALPYVWQGDDAYLKVTGDLFSYQLASATGAQDLTYVVPTRNECDACHATNHTAGVTQPIGIKARHLNRGYHNAALNQLTAWSESGRLRGAPPPAAAPRNADWHGSEDTLEHRARSYLDANCGHCHNPEGAADTSGLWLDYQAHPALQLGVCKPPIAAGSGSGGHLYSIVPGVPAESIIVYRMQTENPATRMPELGRDIAHTEGVQVVSEWIATLDGACR